MNTRIAEFDLIARIRARAGSRGDVVLGIGDDAALLQPPVGMQLVVINEAIDSTKRFGSEHGHTYVNGVLDKAAASLRSTEAQAARPR